MRGPYSWLHHQVPRGLRAAALAAIALGIGVWGAVLMAPAPREAPPMLAVGQPPQQGAQAVAQWFGGRPLRVRVNVVGVIAGEDGRGAALLSVDGAPARAYRAGQALAPGVALEAVTADDVSIVQDGVVERVAAPVGPGSGLRGFIPVSAAN